MDQCIDSNEPDRGREAASAQEEGFVAIARIVRPHGRKGEVAAEILTDFPARFAGLRQIFLENPGSLPTPTRLESTWLHKGRIILKFSGVESISQAAQLRGALVLIPRRERVKLTANAYYLWELIGCHVVAQYGGESEELGTVTDVELTPGTHLLHVETAQGEVLIPLAEAICKRIDVTRKIINIDPPQGLLEVSRVGSQAGSKVRQLVFKKPDDL